MTVLDGIIQGIVQGLTEFLPVSSSGHLSISQHILGIQESNLFFNVMLHVGTLIAVVFVYHKLILRLIKEFGYMIKDIFTGKFKWKTMNYDRNLIMMLIIALIPLFALFIPIPGTENKIKDYADIWTADGYLIIVALSLITTSVLLTIGIMANNENRKYKNKKGKIIKGRNKFNLKDAITVGITQVFAAVFPGISRSGSTLSVSLMRGINKQTALDFSFVLGIPAILAAAVLETKDAFEAGVSIEVLPVISGVITSAIVGFLAIKLFKWLLATNKTYIFILYTACVGLIMLIISIIELISGNNIFTGTPLNF